MKFAEASLGDVVAIYIDAHNCFCEIKAPYRIHATIIATSTKCYLLGWKKTPCPNNATRRDISAISSSAIYLPDQADYLYGLPVWKGENFDRIVSSNSLPEWKLFVNNREGECPCGISRSMCRYHAENG